MDTNPLDSLWQRAGHEATQQSVTVFFNKEN